MNYTTIGLHAVRGAIAASLLAASVGANATPLIGWGENFYFDLGTNDYDAGRGVPAGGAVDADTTTGTMGGLGFNGLLATSVYEATLSGLTGNFYDTNVVSTLANICNLDGCVAPGLTSASLAGPDVTLVAPSTPYAGFPLSDITFQTFLGLDPLNNTQFGDSEGYGQTWALQVQYTMTGSIAGGEPQYTGGSADILFFDLADATNNRTVISMDVAGSDINNANLDIFFSLTYAEAGFLWVDNGNGVFYDANGRPDIQSRLATNVTPPIPTLDQLVGLADLSGDVYAPGTLVAVRQANLNGDVRYRVPEPGSLFLVSLGLLGLTARKKLLRK